jgi:RNA recognition motif-containing protein
MTSLFVGNLSLEVTEQDLKATFAAFGEVTSVRLVQDKFRGHSKGFGFVDMADTASAQAAMDSLKGTQLKGRTLDVAEAQPRSDSGRRPAFRRERPRRGGRSRRGRGRR